MQIYLAVTPQQVRDGMRWHCGLAHVAYRVGPESSLLRQNLLLDTRGGLLSLSDQDSPVIERPEQLSAAVLRECRRRNYSGVLLDFEGAAAADRTGFAAVLDTALTREQRTLYVPEAYEEAAPGAVMLLCTAMSGGNYLERLQETVQRRSAGRIALDLQRLRMDFILPARSGCGTPLTRDALQNLIRARNPAIFFSQDLCARYFTFTQQANSQQAGPPKKPPQTPGPQKQDPQKPAIQEKTHFILFDDAGTLRQKMQTAAALGIQTAFLMYPEVWDLLPRLLGR